MIVPDQHLQRYLANSLEPPEMALLTQRLAEDAFLRQRLVHLERDWTLPAKAPEPWRIPPPDTAWPARLVANLSFGRTRISIDGEFRISVARPTDATRREVVVLDQRADGWAVLTPLAEDQRVATELLLSSPDALHVDLVARPPVGLRRMAVALPSRAMMDAVDFAAPDWGPLQQAIAVGQVPLASIDLEFDLG